MSKVTALMLKNALKQRHKNDVCVPECKTGATWTNNHLKRIDFWALSRSWSKPVVYGYEIKVARGDFLRDDKWTGYLRYCTDFYFVCPPGIIDPAELPPEAGLLVSSANGARLYCKRKAVRRQVTVPESLYRYILMSRAEIVNTTYYRQERDRREYWEQWLKDRKASRDFGHMVSRAIRETIAKEIEAVRAENDYLKRQHKTYEDLRAFAHAHGVDLEKSVSYSSGYKLREIITEIGSGVPGGLLRQIQSATQSLQAVHEELSKRA